VMIDIGWKKLCCPVDLSDESRAALAVAADLSRRFGAELTLLHVDEGAPPPGEDGGLAAWQRQAEAAGAPRVATEETRGDPKTAIAEWANAHGADLVVMGTHGRTGRTRSLVGSVAESTVRQARCPVMVVHGEWSGPGEGPPH
jgi:universal stress protein A